MGPINIVIEIQTCSNTVNAITNCDKREQKQGNGASQTPPLAFLALSYGLVLSLHHRRLGKQPVLLNRGVSLCIMLQS